MNTYNQTLKMLVYEGKSPKQIAEQLGKSRKTIYNLLSEQIFPDYGVHNQAQLVSKVLQSLTK